jgi:hypothetical protein
MEIFVATAGIYLILNGLVASQAEKFKRNPFVSYLIGIFTTPIGCWLYLQNGKKRGLKRVKNKGPWNEWMVKANHMADEENWEGARKAYLKALDLLRDVERNSSGKYSTKYLQSKISEINYAMDVLGAKSGEGTKVVQLPKSLGDSGTRKASNDL